MLRLRGGSALSPFRLEKLTAALKTATPQVSHIYAEYWHFCAVRRDLRPDESAILAKLLTYGAAQRSEDPAGELLLVLRVPAPFLRGRLKPPKSSVIAGWKRSGGWSAAWRFTFRPEVSLLLQQELH